MFEGYVIVSGLPAAGKSTVGQAVAAELGLPLFDKDDFLEARFPGGSIADEERARLSRLADHDLQQAVGSVPSAVVVSWWRPVGTDSPSGTPTDWLFDLEQRIELHCIYEPRVCAERFVTRTRHPAHGDSRWHDLDDIEDRFRQRQDLGPLGIGPIVTVDTTDQVNIDSVVESIRAAQN